MLVPPGMSTSGGGSNLSRPPAVPLNREFGGSVVTQAFREIRTFLARLVTADRLWGNRVEVTFPGAVTLPVAHGLGRRWQGYVQEGSTTLMVVFDGVIPALPLPETSHIYLQSSGAGTVRLYLF